MVRPCGLRKSPGNLRAARCQRQQGKLERISPVANILLPDAGKKGEGIDRKPLCNAIQLKVSMCGTDLFANPFPFLIRWTVRHRHSGFQREDFLFGLTGQRCELRVFMHEHGIHPQRGGGYKRVSE